MGVEMEQTHIVVHNVFTVKNGFKFGIGFAFGSAVAKAIIKYYVESPDKIATTTK